MSGGEDVGVEKDHTRDHSCEPSTKRGFADADGAGDDQQGRADEGPLVGAVRAPQYVADRWNQVGKVAPASADLTRERHTTIMSPRRTRARSRRISEVSGDPSPSARLRRTYLVAVKRAWRSGSWP